MNSIKVYLAAPYGKKDYVKECAQELQNLGIEVTSSWLNEPHAPGTQMSELTPEQHQKYAMRDEIDVREADVFVFFTDPTGTIVRGGRHVEFGMAVILGKPICVVGNQRENIFHYLGGVIHFESWDAVKTYLQEISL